MYEEADKMIAYMNKRFIRLFNTLKTIKFDEQNVLSNTKYVYTECKEIAYKCYKELASKIMEEDQDDILDAWLLGILDGYSPTLKVIYNHEVERKQARCSESLIATKSPEEVDTNLKQWANFTSQMVDDVEFDATIEKFSRQGYEQVMWHTEEDEKVCEICQALDKRVFPIGNIPDKPHYRCRCFITPYGEKNEDK